MACEFEPTGKNYREVNLHIPNVSFTALDTSKLNYMRGDVTIP